MYLIVHAGIRSSVILQRVFVIFTQEFLKNTTLKLVTTERIHELLDLEPRHLGNQLYSTRIRKCMAKCGWHYGRPLIGGEQRRGYIKRK